MAIVTLASKFNFAGNQDWDWTVSSLTGTNIVIENASYKQSFDGNFVANQAGILSGSATATSFYFNNALVYSITGMNADATKLQEFVENEGDTQQTYAFVFAGNDTFIGSNDDDGLLGYAGNDNISGGGGNDLLVGGAGNDIISGGTGYDTATFSGARANYTVASNSGTVSVTDKTGAEGADSITGVERILFADRGIAFDGTGIGGQAYRVYQAAFNRTPDSGGVGYWMSVMEKAGVSLNTIAAGFVASDEFKLAYGSAPTNAQLVAKFYENVLHRPAEKAGFDYWVGVLDLKLSSVPEVLAAISESAENVNNLAPVIGAGFEYVLY